MTLSQLDVGTVAGFLRLEEGDYNPSELELVMAAAKGYLTSYTHLTAEELDKYEDVAVAYLVLCQAMYDNRSLTVGEKDVNPVVQSILNFHVRGLAL